MLRTLLLTLTAGLLVAAEPADDAGKKDLERMQGDWAVHSMTRDGQPLPDDDAQSLFRTVKGDGYTIFRFDKAIGRGTVKLDATKTPRAIDASPANAPAGSPPLPGIYEFDGDKLRICFAGPGGERPKDFSCKAGSGHTLTVWEREKKK
jgi:uncharacterized protein (TIGR03067 family)